jgi:ABC-type Zn uptake system ZnuABC Zn-binding protein ZnuA
VVQLIAAALILSACASVSPAASEGLTVLAAETFLADIAQHVAGERLVVESILQPGVDPHEFQATPQDAIRIAEADVLIINGRGYEAWLEKSLAASGGERMLVEASSGIDALSPDDPHLWMNPRNVVTYVENIRDGLSEADPAGRSTYAANAQIYIGELLELDEWIKAEVAAIPLERRALITNHDALAAFAEAYGFEVAGVVIPSFTSGAAPSAQQMAELIQMIRSLDAPAIFLDASENQDLAQQIAVESGARVVTGLYVETVSEAGGPAPTYLGMMKHNVRLIVDALK